MSAELQQRLMATFAGAFDAAPALVVQAPGRVNLIGEHTDYNDGFVLPCAIEFQTRVAIRPRADAEVRVVAGDYGQALDRFRVDAPIERCARPPWANYVRGVFEALRERGVALQGADVAIAGDVPSGAGLSSSASLEVAVALAVQQAQSLDSLTPTDLALIGQRAENHFVGCQCGIMDQLVSARAQAGQASLIDCRSLDVRAVPMPEETALLIVHSRVQRGLVGSAYNERRTQCHEAARRLRVAALRDARPEDLPSSAAVAADVVWRRARHVITENQRTLDAAQALACNDLTRLGELMAASHRSMRDDFEITVPAVDRLVAILQTAIDGEGGARMTGGGFGGCVIAVLPVARVDAVVAAVQRDYRSPDGRAGTVYATRAAEGASRVPC
jgi:galactokinase